MLTLDYKMMNKATDLAKSDCRSGFYDTDIMSIQERIVQTRAIVFTVPDMRKMLMVYAAAYVDEQRYIYAALLKSKFER